MLQMEDRFQIEQGLWDACKAGDKSAYAKIYSAGYPRLFNYGKKFTADEQQIEDAIQEIFTNFWFNRKKLSGINGPLPYLLVSFRNHLLKSIRKERNTNQHSEEITFDLELSVDQVMIDADKMYEQKINLTYALEKLTAHQKEVIFLKFYENLSYDEISGVFGISTRATYKLVARAVAELRTAYKLKLASSLLSLLSCYIHYY
jgi:RNA polymerase sigma factor (sigma-70 family)